MREGATSGVAVFLGLCESLNLGVMPSDLIFRCLFYHPTFGFEEGEGEVTQFRLFLFQYLI